MVVESVVVRVAPRVGVHCEARNFLRCWRGQWALFFRDASETVEDIAGVTLAPFVAGSKAGNSGSKAVTVADCGAIGN